jgi:hypothetical protein
MKYTKQNMLDVTAIVADATSEAFVQCLQHAVQDRVIDIEQYKQLAAFYIAYLSSAQGEIAAKVDACCSPSS